MNIFTSAIKYFYSNQEVLSQDQLREDFGEFPPRPLKTKKFEFEFKIRRIRGIGALYNSYTIASKVAKSMHPNSKIQTQNSPEFKAVKEYFEQVNLFSVKISKALHIKNEKILLNYLLYLFSVFLTFILFIKLNNKKNGLGYHLSFFQDERVVTIKNGTKSKVNPDSVVSHEHLHFLQHLNSENNRIMRFPEIVLPETKRKDRFLLYIYEKNELEARLHEIVLSYYRFKKMLPVTKKEFFELLGGSKFFGEIVVPTLKINGIDIQDNDFEYPARETEWEIQLGSIFLYTTNSDIDFRIITEILPVMYGNLLRYYGDTETSFNFSKEIERPNFYDVLYS